MGGSTEDVTFTKEEIWEQIFFQEKYFDSEILVASSRQVAQK